MRVGAEGGTETEAEGGEDRVGEDDDVESQNQAMSDGCCSSKDVLRGRQIRRCARSSFFNLGERPLWEAKDFLRKG